MLDMRPPCQTHLGPAFLIYPQMNFMLWRQQPASGSLVDHHRCIYKEASAVKAPPPSRSLSPPCPFCLPTAAPLLVLHHDGQQQAGECLAAWQAGGGQAGAVEAAAQLDLVAGRRGAGKARVWLDLVADWQGL